MVAVCDETLVGKVLRDDKFCIEIKGPFYGGQKLETRKTLEVMKEGTVVNLIGNEIVALAIKHGFVHPDAVIKIANVDHAQIVHF